MSEETQPVRPIPVSLAGSVRAPVRPAGHEKAAVALGSGLDAGDTQPVKTQPVRAAVRRDAEENGSLTETDLGRLVFAYRPRPVSPAFQWAWWLGGVVLGLAPLVYGGTLAVATYQKFGPVPALSRSAAWLLLGGVLLLAWLSISLYRRAFALPGVRLHANGVYIEGRSGRSLPWEQIAGIAHAATAHESRSKAWPNDIRYQASLYPSRGRPVHLYGSGDGRSGLPQLPELVSRIKASLYPVLQPEMSRMFRAGVPLHFGPLRVDQAGLRLRRRRPVPGTINVPWWRVKRITVQSGYFLVELGDRRSPYRLPAGQIPNLEILLKIIDQGVQQ